MQTFRMWTFVTSSTRNADDQTPNGDRSRLNQRMKVFDT